MAGQQGDLLNALYKYAKENKCRIKSEPYMPLLSKQKNSGIYLEGESTIYLSYTFSNDAMYAICLAHELGHHMLWRDGVYFDEEDIGAEISAWRKAEEIVKQLGFSLPTYWSRHKARYLKTYRDMYERR